MTLLTVFEILNLTMIERGLFKSPFLTEDYFEIMKAFHAHFLSEAYNKVITSKTKNPVKKKMVVGQPADKIFLLQKHSSYITSVERTAFSIETS